MTCGVVMCLSVLRGPGAQNIFDLLAQFKRGDCDGTKVRLGRLQVNDVVPIISIE